MSRSFPDLDRRQFMKLAVVMGVGGVGSSVFGGCNGNDDDSPPSLQNSGRCSDPATSPCLPTGALLSSLLACRNWITFAPPAPFNPGAVPANADLLNQALALLTCEGWRGLVTYSLDPQQGLDQVPQIAKQNGFTKVIAGLFVFDEAQFQRERQAALAQAAFIDGYVLGNEVLTRRVVGWSRARLDAEIASLKAATGKPVTTTETYAKYQQDPGVLETGDWIFPTLQFWFDPAIRTPALAVAAVEGQYQALVAAAPGRTVVVKEAWWPTAGEPAATESNQSEFFQQLSLTTVRFVFGEAFDQFWKSEPMGQGPYWGLHGSTLVAKAIIGSLRAVYTGAY